MKRPPERPESGKRKISPREAREIALGELARAEYERGVVAEREAERSADTPPQSTPIKMPDGRYLPVEDSVPQSTPPESSEGRRCGGGCRMDGDGIAHINPDCRYHHPETQAVFPPPTEEQHPEPKWLKTWGKILWGMKVGVGGWRGWFLEYNQTEKFIEALLHQSHEAGVREGRDKMVALLGLWRPYFYRDKITEDDIKELLADINSLTTENQRKESK